MTKTTARLRNYGFSPAEPAPSAPVQTPANSASPDGGALAVTHYICDMLLELRRLSQREKLSFLTTVLEMAYHEAFMIANRVDPSPIEAAEVKRITEMGRSWLKQSGEQQS